MSGPHLKVESISAGYGRATVVSDVSMTAEQGEIVALLGRNGAGKTTTLMAIAGEVPLRAGKVWFGGVEARGPLNKRAKMGLGFVPEQRTIFRRLTVAQNLDLGPGGIAKAVGYAPELERLLDRKAGVLSGGEQQLLCIARVLAADPSLIIVDELSFGLAPIIVDRLLGLLRDAAARGAAIVIVEQQVPHVLSVANRLYVMKKGSIVHEGKVGSLSEIVSLLDDAYLGNVPANGRQPVVASATFGETPNLEG
jgi:branched-chain amino acid transport system ATP-binding protein